MFINRFIHSYLLIVFSKVMSSKKVKNGKINLDINDLLKESKEDNYNFIILNDFKDNYPLKTNVCCWWCCHKFDSIPLGIPKKYDSSGDEFQVTGCFCSIECVYSYVLDNKYNYSKVYPIDIKFMYKKISGDENFKMSDTLRKAPPRQILKMFGGKLSIDEFRKSNYKISVLHAPLTSSFLTCETIEYKGIKKPVEFIKNDLDIRRKKNESGFSEPKKKIGKKSIGSLVTFV
jgi:hypothetical protein